MPIYTVGTTGGAITGRRTAGQMPTTGTVCCCPACLGLECLERPRYFAGQLLSESELNAEQNYVVAKNRLHNRYLVGWGVVCGLEVVCNECEGMVTVRPGYAIDPCGNDIVVCHDQPFDVTKAIQACCEPARQKPDCRPLRADIPDTCKDVEQQWCLTICYEAKEARPATALRQTSRTQCSCGCDNCAGTCACGSNGNGQRSTTPKNGGSANCAQAPSSTGIPPSACEPTRIVEGYRLALSCPPDQTKQVAGPEPGTLAYELEQCCTEVVRLIEQAPRALDQQDRNVARQACCQYFDAVKRFLLQADIQNCDILDELSLIDCPPVAGNASFDAVVQELRRLLILQYRECICLAFLPKCPGEVCDSCVPLAIITVRNKKVIRVCNYGCRKQLISLPTLSYWWSLSSTVDLFMQFLGALCCNREDYRKIFLAGSEYTGANLSMGGYANAAEANRSFASAIVQRLCPEVVRAALAGERNVVDTQPLVGMRTEAVQAELKRMGVQHVTVQSVEADPAWTPDAVQTSANFAPRAIATSQPLTLYTKGNSVVGIAAADPTAHLNLQVKDLQSQVTELRKHIETLRKSTAPKRGPAGGTPR